MDYTPIEAFLVGRCGLTQEQAGRTGYTEYKQRCAGKQEELQERWEIARWEMFMMMSMHPFMKPNRKAKTPQSFYRFPWEKEIVPEMPEGGWEVSEENEKILNELVTRYIAKHGQDRRFVRQAGAQK